MDIKHILEEIIANDTTRNKCATKYLYKNHPEVWDSVMDLTRFLPLEAKPKQRIWHIVNDVWDIPVCPITGERVSWCENRYLIYKSVAAANSGKGEKVRETVTTRGHWRKKDKEKAKKANQKFSRGFENGEHKEREIKVPYKDRAKKSKETCVEKYGVDNPAKVPEIMKRAAEKSLATRLDRYGTLNPFEIPGVMDEWKERAKETCLAKYGVDHQSKDAEIKDKTHQTLVARGFRVPRESKCEREQYYIQVDMITAQSWRQHFYDINPDKLPRNMEYHLDHIYSRLQGFLEGIPPEVIGHWTNLRIISQVENNTKRNKCDKTKEQLFEDFFSAGGVIG